MCILSPKTYSYYAQCIFEIRMLTNNISYSKLSCHTNIEWWISGFKFCCRWREINTFSDEAILPRLFRFTSEKRFYYKRKQFACKRAHSFLLQKTPFQKVIGLKKGLIWNHKSVLLCTSKIYQMYPFSLIKICRLITVICPTWLRHFQEQMFLFWSHHRLVLRWCHNRLWSL